MAISDYARIEIETAKVWHDYWNRAGGSCVQLYWQGRIDALQGLEAEQLTELPPAKHPHDEEE